MIRLLRNITWVISLAAAFAVAAVAPPIAGTAFAASVRTESGVVEGIADNGTVAFKGIPFAAPPIGALRWHAPQPPAPWSGAKVASAFGPICPQNGAYPEGSPPEPASEDCLYLNVWVPAGVEHSARLPVMVWIHGGGLVNGSGSNAYYAGGALARRGVIIVTFNYRLGALGFLAHPEMANENEHKSSGNYGHLDQLAALGWVQRNIAAFGGDKGNVTVFGQSSGAVSISALMASPLARNLFHRAIGQSGGLFEPLDVAPEFSRAGAQEGGVRFAQRLGVSSLAQLRALPVPQILGERFHPHANIDGHFLEATPYETFAAGRQSKVDVLVGSNEAEGLYFMSGRDIRASNLSDELNRDFPPFIVSLIGPGSPADDQTARAAFIAFEGDMRFGWNMWAWARLQARSSKGNAFFYRFSHVPPGEEGASHGAELPYVFDRLDRLPRTWTDGDRRLALTMAGYWTNFAKTGDPNGEGLPPWPLFTGSDERALLIGTDVQAGRLADTRTLVAIDWLYWAVRVLLNYGLVIAGVIALLVLVFVWRLVMRFLVPRDATG